MKRTIILKKVHKDAENPLNETMGAASLVNTF